MLDFSDISRKITPTQKTSARSRHAIADSELNKRVSDDSVLLNSPEPDKTGVQETTSDIEVTLGRYAAVRRPIRYVLSAIVGLGVMSLTAVVDDGNLGLMAMIPLIYGTTTAFALDNAETIRTLSGEGTSWKIGMLGGGIGAGSTVGLFQQSFAAGIAGYGLFVFGIVLVIAEVGNQADG
ncbi:MULTISPECIES: hypothetical protein [unclassified Haloferax]|uniref:hypothetical protein n=1 Tax=Haloferax TaxID=2251 RepID=UPI001EF9E06F|nr:MULTISPECIES: hypothetical protein [unclassified Haloferax]